MMACNHQFYCIGGITLPEFVYKARLPDGEIIDGNIEADSQSDAIAKLEEMQYFVVSCQDVANVLVKQVETIDDADDEEGGSIFDKISEALFKKKVPLKTQVAFFKQMAIMTRSGMSAPMALGAVADYLDNPSLKETVLQLRGFVERGFSIAQSMQACESFFDVRILALVGAGEESGHLDDAFMRISILLEKRAKLISKIKAAMFYPSFVMVFAILVLVLFVSVILPKFKSIFAGMKVAMPPLTATIFTISEFLKSNWIFVVGGFVGIVVFIKWMNAHEETKPIVDSIKLKIPMVKDIILKSSLAQSMQTLASLVAAGVPLVHSLELARDSVYNEIIRNHFNTVTEGVLGGYPLSQSLMSSGMFPSLVSQMVYVGEQSGSVDEMLGFISEWYDEDMQDFASKITAMMEPIMIITIGGLVMVIILAIFTPILTAIQTMGRPA